MGSFNNVNSGDAANSSCIQQILDVLKGTAGVGNIPIAVVAVNDTANFAVDVMNLDPTNERTFRARNSSGQAVLQCDITGPQADPTGSGLALIVNANATQTLSNKTLNNSSLSLLAASSNVVQVPQVRLTHTSTQALANNTVVALTWNTELWDNDGLHSTVTTPTRIIPSRAGLWSLGGSVAIDPNSSGFAAAIIRLNGATTIAQTQIANAASFGTVVQVSTDYQLSTSDYAELCAQQTSGASAGASSVAALTHFWATFRGST